MDSMSFDIVSVRPIYQGWGRFMTAKVRLPDGSVADRQIEDHGTSVAVLLYDVERKVALLVRQPRTAATFASGCDADEMLEAVAGRLEDGAEDKDEARREAQEEVGGGGACPRRPRRDGRHRSAPRHEDHAVGPDTQAEASGPFSTGAARSRHAPLAMTTDGILRVGSRLTRSKRFSTSTAA